jgi:membrane-bound ClpP family serine protease
VAVNMKKGIIILQGLSTLIGIIGFFYGYFIGIKWLMMLGGIILIIEDILSVASGGLNPIFPIMFAIVLSFLFTPWYVGVFWSIAVFAVFDIPTAIYKIFNAGKMVEEIDNKVSWE